MIIRTFFSFNEVVYFYLFLKFFYFIILYMSVSTNFVPLYYISIYNFFRFTILIYNKFNLIKCNY